MTNTEEQNVGGASFESMQYADGEIQLPFPLGSDEDEQSEQELVIAVGNAAQAARAAKQGRAIIEEEPDSGISDSGIATSMNGDGDEENVEQEFTLSSKTRASTSTAGSDYVGADCGEVYGGYKACGRATPTQSEQFIQQPKEELESNVLTSTSLFLAKAWNCFTHLFVTIIFLNLVYFAARVRGQIESVRIGETSSEVEGKEEAGKESENCENKSKSASAQAHFKEEKMSPNTCSIQNPQQEVEKAEEAIVATAASEKSEVSVVVIAPEEVVMEDKQNEEAPVEVTQQKKEIRIILPKYDESDEEDSAGERRDSVDSVSSEGSGNLGDTEDKSEENSDSNSDIMSNKGDAEGNEKEVAEKIILQVESMFSDEHLAKDGFLLKHVRRRSDGFVSLKLVAGLRKVKQISREFSTVLDALKDSTKLEVNGEGTKVRRVEPLTQALRSVPIKAKDKKDGSSNDESTSKTGNKENEKNRRHSAIVQGNANPNHNQNRRNSHSHNQNRKMSNTSTSSNNSSRNNSFSKPPGMHPADLFRNVYTSSGEDSPQVGRRRGGSLPITALQKNAGMSPNSSPPNAYVMIGPNGGARPKSNSYCEGAGPSTMSPWLQRRKASASSRLSNGELSFAGVIRQPRGPDGTKGFASGYRAMILQERLQQQTTSAVSA